MASLKACLQDIHWLNSVKFSLALSNIGDVLSFDYVAQNHPRREGVHFSIPDSKIHAFAVSIWPKERNVRLLASTSTQKWIQTDLVASPLINQAALRVVASSSTSPLAQHQSQPRDFCCVRRLLTMNSDIDCAL